MYLRNGLAQLQRATSEGVPVEGNFVWSAMDNWNGPPATARALASCTSTSRRSNAFASSARRGIARRRAATPSFRWRWILPLRKMVARGGIEPPARGFSVNADRDPGSPTDGE
jgi:hypothetical protein